MNGICTFWGRMVPNSHNTRNSVLCIRMFCMYIQGHWQTELTSYEEHLTYDKGTSGFQQKWDSNAWKNERVMFVCIAWSGAISEVATSDSIIGLEQMFQSILRVGWDSCRNRFIQKGLTSLQKHLSNTGPSAAA